MSASNLKCHNKGCLCATCYHLCSRCLVSNEKCYSEHGIAQCKGYNKMQSNKYGLNNDVDYK